MRTLATTRATLDRVAVAGATLQVSFQRRFDRRRPVRVEEVTDDPA